MPEPVEQPAPAPKAPAKRVAAGVVAAAAKLKELKEKYRLDTEVNLYFRGPDGKRMGLGPVLDDQVFNKFAELDTSRNKRYLDWMLFQAGGGQKAFNHSRELWGDNTPEKTPEEFFKQFNEEKPDHIVHYTELNYIVQKMKDKGIDLSRLVAAHEEVEKATGLPNLAARFEALVKLMKVKGIIPGREERVAVEIIANKFKGWIKNQLATKTRDRVHATSVYSRLIRGQSREETEEKWLEMVDRYRREYIFGDQDMLIWDAFGYNRHWPGRDNVYERVYNTMRQFLINADNIKRYNERLKTFNASVAERNKTLPPDQQIPARQAIPFNVNIGKVNVDAQGNLIYKGPYPNAHTLVEVNEKIGERLMKERVAQDVQYAGPKGVRGRGSKIYSDQNLDVRVPLTVAAAIEGGHPKWPISAPEQISNIRAQGNYSFSTWTKHATGEHDHFEWRGSPAIPVYFTLRTPGVPEGLTKILMTVFMDDLVDLQAPYVGTLWHVAGSTEELSFTDIIKLLKTQGDTFHSEARPAYFSVILSFTKAMNAIKEWGKEFDPHDVIADYVAHHRERMQGKRTLGEQVRIRANQIVQALLEQM